MSIDCAEPNGWERILVEDCCRIVKEAAMGVIKKWHELGTRIMKDERFLSKRYGDSYTANLAKKIKISRRSLDLSIQFVKKFPSWGQVEEMATRRQIASWRQLSHEILPDRRSQSNVASSSKASNERQMDTPEMHETSEYLKAAETKQEYPPTPHDAPSGTAVMNDEMDQLVMYRYRFPGGKEILYPTRLGDITDYEAGKNNTSRYH